MMITTLSVTCSVIVIKLHYKSTETRPPQWLRVVMFNYLSRVVWMNHNNQLSRLTKLSHRKRDTTWSETATEEIRSQTNSHGTVTPDGAENFELLHQRRRPAEGENNVDCRGHANHSVRAQAQAHELQPLEDSADVAKGIVVVNEWKKIAEVLDRVFFYLFVIGLIVPTATILGFVRLFKPPL